MFDRYVQGTKPSWKRRAVLTVSLGVHVVAAIVLFVYSFIHIEEITPPALSLTFFSAPPPPPPPPPPAAHHKTEVHHIEHKMVQPTTVQPIVQPKQEEKEEEETDDGEEGGVEGGVAGGVKGGVIGGVVGGTLGGTGAPVKARNVPPHQLDDAKISGDVPHLPGIVLIQRKGTGDAIFLAKICIDQSGKVSQVQVLQGIPGADAEVVAGIRGWKYKPQAIPICSINKIVYTIN